MKYVEIAKRNGLDLSYIFNNDIAIQFGDLQAPPYNMGDEYVGLALGLKDNKQITIVIDRVNWRLTDDVDKWTTMMHELCHDVLNIQHSAAETSLMYPSSGYYTMTDLFDALDRTLIKYKIENNIK